MGGKKMSQICMFDLPLEKTLKPGRNSYTPKNNPMREQLGPGPEGATCRTCKHKVSKRLARTYLKCALRPNTSGSKTDIRAKWPACVKYEENLPMEKD